MSTRIRALAAYPLMVSLACIAGAEPLPASRPATPRAIVVASKVVLGKLPPANMLLPQDDTKPLEINVGKARSITHVITCSADARDMVMICRQDKSYAMWHQGKFGEPYSFMTAASFSPGGARYAYIATRPNDTKNFVVVDDKETTPWTAIVGEGLRWSPDGKHLAYFALDGDDPMGGLVLDGKISEQHFRNMWGPFFSPDSQHCMYNVDQPGIGLIIDDSKPEGEYHGSKRPFWSPDSKRTAMAVNALDSDTPMVMLLDGVLGEQGYKDIADAVFSPDSQKLAYIAKVQKGYQAVLDGKNVGPTFGGMYAGTLRFMPDGKSIRWIGSTATKTFAVFVDGAKVSEFPAGTIIPFGVNQTFSADGRRFAYVQYTGNLSELTKTGQKKFTAGKDFKAQVVVDAKIFEPFDDAWAIIFSADSRRVAAHVVLGQNKQAILADGVQGNVYPKIVVRSASFSPDSSHLAYLATKASGKAVLVVDGIEGPEFDESVKETPLVWVDNETLRSLMIDKSEVASVTWKITPKLLHK